MVRWELMTESFVVQRNDLRTTHWDESPAPSLEEGQVRLRIDAFALTSNNITYAALGDVMNYWQFYPTGDPSTGRVPVWGGFASVVESRCPGVEVDERFYGYWPMADEVVLQATDVHPGASPRDPNTGARCTRSTTSTCGAAPIRGGIGPTARRSRRCCGRCSPRRFSSTTSSRTTSSSAPRR